MRRAPIVGLVAAALTLGQVHTARGEDRSGVRPEVLSLPGGPGSIEGLGESFEPNGNTGASSYSVSIDVPPGVAGFAPQLGLHYSSGSGNGEMGIGWSLGLPSVQLGTDRGLPRYDGSDEIVIRGMGGGGSEELVRGPDGYYRFRIEGAFVRAEARVDATWEVRNRTGVRFRFGTTESSTIRSGSKVFAWLLTEQIDTYGNRIEYEWSRDASGRPYLQRITYNDFSASTANVVEFEWTTRPDALTSYVATFGVATFQRLAAVRVRHAGELIRRYDLSYDDAVGVSRLIAVRMVGRDGTTALPTLSLAYANLQTTSMHVVTVAGGPARALGATTELDDVDGDALPDLLVMDPSLDGGTYSVYRNMDGSSFGAREVLTDTPSVWLDSPEVQLADLDGDGASDVLARVSPASDGMRFYPASGPGFGPPVTITPNLSTALNSADIRIVDLDHDRLSDWIRIDPSTGGVSIGINGGGGSFAVVSGLPAIDPSELVSFSGGARLTDCNGDGMSDIVLVRSESFRCWPSVGRGRFALAQSVVGAPSLTTPELDRLEVRDVDDDGLPDLVIVGTSEVRLWRNIGGARFSDTPTTIGGTPVRDADTVVRVADMNGNGSSDIVWIDPTETAAPWRYLDVLSEGSPGLLTRIDNGLGKVVSIEYAGIGTMRAWSRARGISWTARSSVGQVLVSAEHTDDGLGNVIEQRFGYADAYFDPEAREFRGFRVSVVEAVGDVDQPSLFTTTEFDLGRVDESRKGFTISSETRDANDGLFVRTVRTYETRIVGVGSLYSFASSETTETYELGATPVVTSRSWDYDDLGNPILETNLGDVSNAIDGSVVRRQFASNVPSWILGSPCVTVVESEAGVRESEVRSYFDGPEHQGLPLCVLGQHGVPTRTESWIVGDRFALDESLAHDTFGNVIETRDAGGGAVRQVYDDESHTFIVREEVLVDESRWIGWTANHDRAFGVITSVTDPNGVTARVELDALGRVVASIAPGDDDAHPTARYEYHFGAPLSWVRSEQRTSEATEPLVSYRYTDGLGRARGTWERSADGRWISKQAVEFGKRGWSIATILPEFESSADWSAPTSLESAARHRYDALGRVVETTLSDGSMSRVVRGPFREERFGENDLDPTSVEFGTPTVTTFDVFGHRLSIDDVPNDSVAATTFRYDARGNLTLVSVPGGRRAEYDYDGRSRVVRSKPANGGSRRYAYLDSNEVESTVDARGFRVEYQYDLAGREIVESAFDPSGTLQSRVAKHYDREDGLAIGRLASVDDAAGHVDLTYDARGAIIGNDRVWNDGDVTRSRWQFDSMGRITRREFADATYLDYRYDARGLVSRVGDLVVGIERNEVGGVSRVDYGNGVVDTAEFDGRLRPARQSTTNARGEILRGLRYTFDRASNLTQIEDERPGVDASASHSAEYTLDDRHRLVREEAGGGATSWTHDDLGNVISVSSSHDEPRLNRTFSYGENGADPDQLTRAGEESFAYDQIGGLVRDGTKTYAWDAMGRLARIESGTSSVEYQYDWSGRRVAQIVRDGGRTRTTRFPDPDTEVVDGRWTKYVRVDGAQTIRIRENGEAGYASAITDRERSPRSHDWRTADLLGVALAIGWLAVVAIAARTRRALPSSSRFVLAFLLGLVGGCGCDHERGPNRIEGWPSGAEIFVEDLRGSIVGTVDANGDATSSAAYHAYGMLRSSSGARQSFGFAGQRDDARMDVLTFAARPYRADLGRFLAPDPAQETSPSAIQADAHAWNSYAYANSNPATFADPDGAFAFVLVVLVIPEAFEVGVVVVGSAVVVGAAIIDRIEEHREQVRRDAITAAPPVPLSRDAHRTGREVVTAPPPPPPAAAPDRPTTTGRTIVDETRRQRRTDQIGTVFVTYTLTNSRGQIYVGRTRGPVYAGESQAVAEGRAVRKRMSRHHRADFDTSTVRVDSSVIYRSGPPQAGDESVATYGHGYAVHRGREDLVYDELVRRGRAADQDHPISSRKDYRGSFRAAAIARLGPVNGNTPIRGETAP